ncbi:hypothetical protein QO010_004152 [Caulobacter ginsengisoli]|uniref:DUF4274 domain-containing protein n=1 Tax=Caulobacter ginsengisoli TaxID=400775 RepID=A0ABU0IWH4_9CAUL|nr:DUF4274 domain-containing protein [Caulobacter ginsengisoli]MDQ0466359.1 hypothetical protein [Caulobacter ginsengisoli]
MDRRQLTLDRTIAWLAARGPRDWHGVAVSWNWDQGDDVPLWIVRQDACDAGTAATLFWRSAPEDLLDRNDDDPPPHPYLANRAALIAEVLGRWPGGYPTRHFASEGADHVYPAVPPDLAAPFPGDRDDEVVAHAEGVPLEVELEIFGLLGETPSDGFLKSHHLRREGGGYVRVEPVRSPLDHFRAGDLTAEELERLLRDPTAFADAKDHQFFVWNVVFTRLLAEEQRRRKAGEPFDAPMTLQARMASGQEADWLAEWDRLIAPPRPRGVLGRLFGRP